MLIVIVVEAVDMWITPKFHQLWLNLGINPHVRRIQLHPDNLSLWNSPGKGFSTFFEGME